MSITHTSNIRVSYSDTDQMGFMHHSNYAKHFETARWELFRNMGLPYFELEKQGYLLPVIDMTVSYIKPAFYDDVLTIATKLNYNENSLKFEFLYTMHNSANQMINKAKVITAITDKNGKPCRPPKFIFEAIYCNISAEIFNPHKELS